MTTTTTCPPVTSTKLVRDLAVGDTIVAFDGKPLTNPSTVTRLSNKAVTKRRSGWFVFHGTRAFLPTGSDDVRTCEVQLTAALNRTCRAS